MIIKIILLSFIFFAAWRLVRRFREGAITSRWLIMWLVFWCASAVVVAVPEVASRAAAFVGIGRGADLAVYVAVLALFYLQFRFAVKVERMEKDISKVVEELAIRDWKKE